MLDIKVNPKNIDGATRGATQALNDDGEALKGHGQALKIHGEALKREQRSVKLKGCSWRKRSAKG